MKLSLLSLCAGLSVLVNLSVYAADFIVEVRATNTSTTTQESSYINNYLSGSDDSHTGPVTTLKDVAGQTTEITFQFTADRGKIWDTNADFQSDFNNDAALQELKDAFGEFPKETMLAKITSGGQAETVHTIKLGGFTPNTGVTVYMFLSSLNQKPTAGPTVTGGTGSFSFATNSGSGFENTFQFSELNHLTLVKWEGEVTGTELTFQPGGKKTGMSALFLHVVPEPTAAWLMLSGVAGLCLQRKGRRA